MFNSNLFFLFSLFASICISLSEQFEADTKIDKILANRNSKIVQYELPSTESIRIYDNLVVNFNQITKNPNWVIQYINNETLSYKNGKYIERAGIEFFTDDGIHEYFRTDNADFKSSGYDRGHLAPAGDYAYNFDDMKRTFVLSNISPQVGVGFNRGIWMVLEAYVRNRAKKSPNAYVCSGPLYLAKKEKNGKSYVKYQVVGSKQIAVPTHFFKVLLIQSPINGKYEFENFLIENKEIKDGTPLTTFQVPLDTIERAAGFLIFENFPDKYNLKQNQLNDLLDNFKFGKKSNQKTKTDGKPKTENQNDFDTDSEDESESESKDDNQANLETDENSESKKDKKSKSKIVGSVLKHLSKFLNIS